jgi:hypothetical protein
MNSKRLYFVLIAVIGVMLFGLVAGAYGVNSLLSTRSNSLVSLEAKSQALAQEQLSLATAKKDVQKYAGLEQIAQSVVPEDKDQAEAVREIVNIAAANNVSLASITFPASSLGTSNGSSIGVTTPAPGAISSNSSTAPTNTLSQLEPVTGIPGVYELSITIDGDPNQPVQYSAFINFLSALELNRRTAQVSAITIEPATTNPNLLTFTLDVNEYIKP